MMPRKYKKGYKFESLEIKNPYFEKRSGRWFHLCICECGNEKLIDGAEIGKGVVKSCGCKRLESLSTHKMSGSAEYATWAAMIQRCRNKNSTGS